MAEPIKPPDTVKPGLKTTEFWLSITTAVVGIVGQFSEVIPGPWGTVLAAIATAGYAVSRGFAKQ